MQSGHTEEVSWLAFSIVASIVLTIVLNVALRAFPGASRRLGDALSRWAEPGERDGYADEPQPRVRWYFPWKAMLIGSIVLTVVINIVLALLR